MNGSERKRGGYFREWRDFTGLSQEEAAHKAARDRTHLSKIERGLEPYSQGWLERLAEAYYCTPADLLSINPFDADARDLVDLFRRADPQIQRAVMRILDGVTNGASRLAPKGTAAALSYTQEQREPLSLEDRPPERPRGLPIDRTGLDQPAKDAALARLAKLKRKPKRR